MTLQSYWQNAVGRFSHQPYRVLAVSLNQGEVHGVQSRHIRGQAIVEEYFSIPLLDGCLADQINTFKTGWNQQAPSFDELIVVFPHQDAIVRTLMLPAADSREIQEMVRLQAARQTPMGIDDLAIAHQVLERASNGYSRVLMVIVRTETLRRYLNFFHQVGLAPQRVVLDSLVSLPFIHGRQSEEGLTLVVDIEDRVVRFGFFDQGQLTSLRSVSMVPSEDSVATAQWSTTFREEVKRTLLSYPAFNASNGAWSTRVAGPEKLIQAARECLQGIVKGSVSIVTPRQRASFKNEKLRGVPICWPVFAASLQLSTSLRPQLNLLPEAQQREGTLQGRRRELIGVLVFALLLAGSFSSLVAQQMWIKKKELARLNRFSQAIFPQVKDLRRMERSLDAVQSQLNKPRSFLNVMAELNRLLPNQVSISVVDFEQDRSLLIQGICLSLADAVRLAEILQKSPIFSAVELRSSDTQRVRDQDVVSFVLYCRLDRDSTKRKGFEHAKA